MCGFCLVPSEILGKDSRNYQKYNGYKNITLKHSLYFNVQHFTKALKNLDPWATICQVYFRNLSSFSSLIGPYKSLTVKGEGGK